MESDRSPVSVTRIPDPGEARPGIAWPTVGLWAGATLLWFGSSTMWLAAMWPWWITTLLNAVAAYLLFTVAHEAAHHSAASGRLNQWLGRLSMPLFAPHSSFKVFRFIHMQHHRFTNHADGSDPDHYTMAGPAWQRPLRWTSVDLQYMFFYAKHLERRPKKEVRMQVLTLLAFLSICLAAILSGHVIALLVLLIVPCRLAVLYLAWAFDYLPHRGLHEKPSGNKFKTTRNRIGLEWLLTPFLMYQNYHLVHHLHPVIPFYRYLAVWRKNEDRYLEGDPELSTPRGRPITPDEYRRMRDLVEHDHG